MKSRLMVRRRDLTNKRQSASEQMAKEVQRIASSMQARLRVATNPREYAILANAIKGLERGGKATVQVTLLPRTEQEYQAERELDARISEANRRLKALQCATREETDERIKQEGRFFVEQDAKRRRTEE